MIIQTQDKTYKLGSVTEVVLIEGGADEDPDFTDHLVLTCRAHDGSFVKVILQPFDIGIMGTAVANRLHD